MSAMDGAGTDGPGRGRFDDLALVRGVGDTKATLRRWNEDPLRVVAPWMAVAFAIGASLLAAVYVIGLAATPDTSFRWRVIGVNGAPAGMDDVLDIVQRNSLVLALHSMACLAGYIALSSLPAESARYSGAWRWIHDRAGRLAMIFVAGATIFSLTTQAYVLGYRAQDLSTTLDVPLWQFLLTLTPHALPELMAVFLPLAAWLLASRRQAWDELLAATIATTALAIPIVVASAYVEVYVSPYLIRGIAG